MTRGRKNLAQRKRRKAVSETLVAHRAFAPMLGLWGVALAGASVMVIAAPVFGNAIDGTMIASLGGLAQPLAAGLAALLLGSGLLAIATAASRKARRRSGAPSVAEYAVRRVHPIDPARDLGTRSLDDPIDAMPFARPAWQDEGKVPATAASEPDVATPSADEAESAIASEPAATPVAEPLAMDLADFAVLPGRNAVWVEKQAEVAPAPAAPAPAAPAATLREPAPLPEPGTAALARLRAVPTSELSMVEMVERFAGALYEHRASPPTRSLSAADLAAREAALAEALRALASLSGDDGSSSVREPLRAALAQFQTPRRVGAGVA